MLGEQLCATTVDVLWRPARARVLHQRPGASLECRVGSGQATYHRFDASTRSHRITYGMRMITAKFRGETANGWLSSREIRKYGYFGGAVSTRNLLAHTCCHEFAHLLQQVAGKRLRGSVHNPDFYRLLDELHADGTANEVRNQLVWRAERVGLHLPDEPLESAEPQLPRNIWRAGTEVSFASRGRAYTGVIERVNRKTCTVAGTGRSRHLNFRVPFALLSVLESLDG
jgi:hypothetical protein